MFSSRKTAAPLSGGYNLTKSLRFRSSATAYLNRTPGSASNRQTWTWSAWVKRGVLSSATSGMMFTAGTSGSNDFEIDFESNDQILIYNRGGMNLQTTQVFRDPAAWYHFVVAIDTTQATSTNRCKIYVNGVQITSFATSTYPTLNENTSVNNTVAQYIGRRSDAIYFDGYMTEINFIDGQALTPSSFGSTNALTGVWQPAKYTGTYGTNGFYLPFTNITSTSTLGNDSSGNGNNWTTNNFSLTAGSTYDSMYDVPTLTSATVANYCVLNPLSNDSTNTLSNANLSYSIAANQSGYPTSTFQFSSGKWYWEVTVSSTYNIIGIVLGTTGTTTQLFTTGYGYYANNGNKYVNGTSSAYGSTYTTNDVIGVAVDLDSGTPTITFYKNNTSQGAITIAAGQYKISGGNGNSAGVASGSYNFGQQPWAYTPPTGFVALNTYNL